MPAFKWIGTLDFNPVAIVPQGLGSIKINAMLDLVAPAFLIIPFEGHVQIDHIPHKIATEFTFMEIGYDLQ